MLRVFTLGFLSLFVCSLSFGSFPEVDPCATELSGANPARILAHMVMKQAQFVNVDVDRATHVAQALAREGYEAFDIPTWNYPPYPGKDKMSVQESIRFLLVCDAINYRYVTDDGAAEYSGDGMKGAGLMVQRVAAAWDRLRDPMTLARLTDADVAKIFDAAVPMPDISARRKHLNEVGAYFVANPKAGHADWLDEHKTPVGLALHLARSIPGFNEPFLKRAQLFVGMVIGRYRDEPGFPTAFTNAGQLTVYADYVLPAVLYRMGIVRYHPDVERQILQGQPFAANSREEAEIRAATIVAADALKAALIATGRYPELSILGLDFGLWIQAKEIDIPNTEMPASAFVRPMIRYHRATTTAY